MTTLKTEIIRAGAPIGAARAAMIMVHGRGASAQGILELRHAFDASDVVYVAPQAESGSWYPYSFMSPIARNEPDLSNALHTLSSIVDDLAREGMPAERVLLLGFSQGACLALEFAARNARRFGGVIALSGGLIGPEGTPRDYAGSLAGTPVFLGCSDVDAHIPLARVHQSTEMMRKLGGDVTEKIYPGMGHTIIQDEVEHVRAMLNGIAPAESRS